MRPPRSIARALVALVVVLLVVATAPLSGAQEVDDRPGKVLVVTAPALRWADLVEHDLPHIEGWMSDAAVAMLSLRTLGARTGIGEGYVTMGAGNRASASASIAGLALEPGERFEEGTAAQAYERRTGIEPTGELLHLGFPAVARANARYLYGAEPGALATVLHAAGLRMGVVANGDLGIGLATDPATADPPTEDVPVGDDTEAEVDEELPAEEPTAEEPAEVDEVVEDEDPLDELPPAPPQQLSLGEYGRAAALAAMDDTGQVVRGRADGLLRRDVAAPYGVRYHPDTVLDAFAEVWADVDVAVVELSDLDRADSYRREAERSAASEMWRAALAQSDELFGELLDAVDPGTTVILASPAPPRSAETLGVFAMATAGDPSGGGEGQLARSGTTRRPGYVTLPDIAPTIVRHFDLDQPTSMTGTLIRGGEAVGVDQQRFEAFADTTSEARFRDRATGPVSVVFVVVQILAYALAAVAVARRRRWTRPVSYLALVVLATPPVGFLAGLLHVEGGDVTSFTIAVFAAAVVVAAAAEALGALAGRRWPRTRATLPPLLLVALSWLVLVVDVMTGGELQINTVFGYSPLVAGRFAGFGNLAFALVGVGAVVVACGAWATVRLAAGPADGSARLRGAAAVAVVAFLGVTVIVDGAPMWGSDVGGVLATVPGFAVLVLVAMGVRVDWKRALVIGIATVVAIGIFAALDLRRAEEDRTHLGRLVDRTFQDDGGGFAEVVERKLTTNLNILTSSIWTLTIPFALGLLIYLARRRTGLLRDLQEQVPGIRPMLAGGLLVAVLGFALNDSGVAVPAMMFAVLLPYLTYVILRWDPARR